MSKSIHGITINTIRDVKYVDKQPEICALSEISEISSRNLPKLPRAHSALPAKFTREPGNVADSMS